MDHLTADSDIVLASMGGRPKMAGEEVEDASNGSSDANEGLTNGVDIGKSSAAERGGMRGEMKEE